MSVYENLAKAFNKTPATDVGTMYVLANDALVALGKAEVRISELSKRLVWTATIPGGECRIFYQNGCLAITAIPESDGEFLVRRVDEPSGEGESDG